MEILWAALLISLGVLAVLLVVSATVGLAYLIYASWKILPEFFRELDR